jgi:polyisoprenoid-binding protein YceI
VGASNQVAGQFAASLSDLGTAKLGEIKINARTLKTDEEMRDRMTGNRILNTAQYEFITFAPTAITGLSGSAARGDERRFQVQGNLTVRDATRPVVFDVTMNVVSENELAVEANTTIRRSDFGIEVRGPAFVANVGDEVRLEYSGKLRAM